MNDLIHVGRTEDRMTDVPVHEHAFWELIYVRVGTATFCAGAQRTPIAPGSIILVRPHQLHCERSEVGYGNYFLFFQNSFLSPEKPFYQLHDAPNAPIRALVELLHAEFCAGHPYEEGVCTALLGAIHRYIQALLPITNQNVYVEQLRREIEERFREVAYTPSAHLSSSPFCPEHLRRLFVRSMGVTPLQYLISLRINYAKSLIDAGRTGTLSFKQVAYASGYSDYYYFSRQFKQQTGFSPRKWARISPYPGRPRP